MMGRKGTLNDSIVFFTIAARRSREKEGGKKGRSGAAGS